MIDRAPIGVLGGSFNPPHPAHRALVMYAMRRLDLAGIKVLVSPQNPLKKKEDYLPIEERMRLTEEQMRGLPKVTVEPEAEDGPVYAVHTVSDLLARERHRRFVYLMGADSFANLHRWAQWRSIMDSIPIAVISRPGYRMQALNSKAALAYSEARLPARLAARLARHPTPAWCFLEGLSLPISSTELRDRKTLY
ncbi:MAG: nicotinate-nucleotide adenylyltransferase [Parvularcula sp.]|jgi:nicotinate-nucleotide adenylyltransferase|nr:nicotinate-nucleotide adenylyltransferase [Parvularcula sp.]